MKKTFYLIVALLSAAVNGYAQDEPAPEFTVVGKRPIESLFEKGERALVDQNGNMVGKYKTVPVEARLNYEITLPDNTSIKVDALSKLILCQDRIFVYGHYIDPKTPWEDMDISLKIYSLSGDLIKDWGIIGQYPATMELCSNGDLLVIIDHEISERVYKMTFSKYDKNGVKIWERETPRGILVSMAVSPECQNIAVSLHTRESEDYLFFFNADGQKLYEDTTFNMTGSPFEFISEDKLMGLSGGDWAVYELARKPIQIYSGWNPGDVVMNYPITRLPEKNMFLFLYYDNIGEDRYVLSAIDNDSGKVINTSIFDVTDSPIRTFRRIKIIDGETFEFMLDREVLTLRIK